MTKEINANPGTIPEEKNEAPKRKTKEKVPKIDKKPEAEAPTGPVASGPASTGITKVLEKRLSPPGEKELKELPELKASLECISKTASKMIEDIEKNCPSLNVNKDEQEKKPEKDSIQL